MNLLPLFPSQWRSGDHFSKGQQIVLIQLNGTIHTVTVKSVSESGITYTKKEGDKPLAHNTKSPLIISENEFLWAQGFLQQYSAVGDSEILGKITKDAFKGNYAAIVYLTYLTLIERVHGLNPVYEKTFFNALTRSIINGLTEEVKNLWMKKI
jgi:hypothetical protein